MKKENKSALEQRREATKELLKSVTKPAPPRQVEFEVTRRPAKKVPAFTKLATVSR